MKTILAIQPDARQIAYAVFKGATLVNRGTKHLAFRKPLRQRTYQTAVPYFRGLVERYDPDVVILPSPTTTPDTARNRVLRGIRYESTRNRYSLANVSRTDIRKTFKSFLKVGRVNKDSIMRLLSKWFPELLEFLPKPRRLWESPNYWVPMFDAVSLAVTYLCHNE